MTDASSLPEAEKEPLADGQEQEEEMAARREGVERMLTGQEAPQDTEQPGSKAIQDGGAAPDDVGESVTRSAEEVATREGEPGRVDTGTQGPSDRPTGTSTGRDATGVDSQAPPVP